MNKIFLAEEPMYEHEDWGAIDKVELTPSELERIKEKFKPQVAWTKEELQEWYDKERKMIEFDLNILKKLSKVSE